MEEKVYSVKSWAELKKLVDNTNPFKEVLVVVGFVRKFKENKNNMTQETQKVYFRKCPREWFENEANTKY